MCDAYKLTTGDFTNGAKILHMPTDLPSNILTLQLIRKKYSCIVPAIYKMYRQGRPFIKNPTARSKSPTVLTVHFPIQLIGK